MWRQSFCCMFLCHGTVYCKLHSHTQQIKQTENSIFVLHVTWQFLHFTCLTAADNIQPDQALCLKYNWRLLIFTTFTQIKALNCRIVHSHILRAQGVGVLALFIPHSSWLFTRKLSYSQRCCPAGIMILEFCT